MDLRWKKIFAQFRALASLLPVYHANQSELM